MNKQQIIKALNIWFKPGDIFEIRILDAVLANSNWAHTASGYFDFDYIEDIPNQLANFKTYGGIYVTLNPVNPDLLARANNRFKKAKTRETTSDKDILCRRWLLIDVDPVRPAGISATNAERDLSFDKAAEIAEGLSSINWPQPLCVNSGNGTQLLYRIDQPSDDEGLIQRCLQEIAACSTDKVHVDLSVHNPARICRLPGTWNCKGDSTDNRPHRLAEIISCPEKIKVVSDDLLQKIANCDEQDKSSGIANKNKTPEQVATYNSFDSTIDEYNSRGDITPLLEKHGWTLKSESDQQYWLRSGKKSGQHSATYNGTVFYVFSDNAAPFEAKGYNRFGVYKALEHDGNDAEAIKALSDQGYGVNNSDIDLSFIMPALGIKQGSIEEQSTSEVNVETDLLIKPLAHLMDNFCGLNTPVIHGVLREGETMNIIASPKVGKSWFAMRLAISIASGIDWLRFPVEQGRVLHLDNELFENTLTDRYQTVAKAMELAPKLFNKNIDTLSMRGKLQDIISLGNIFKDLPPDRYKLVILDAFYRTLPSGTDENDNSAIANIYNLIDRYARELNCAFVLIHHSSKGNQALKSVTDVGAGAGAQSRAVDTHLIIRPHEEQDIFVMESAIRSWAPIEPLALRWQWPLFTPAADVDTSALLDFGKNKPKGKEIDMDEFVDNCVATYDPCAERSVVHEAQMQYGMPERTAKEKLALAVDRQLVAKIRVGSRMQYVKIRNGITGDKALEVAALIEHNPEKSSAEIAEKAGVSKQYVNQIKRETGGN